MARKTKLTSAQEDILRALARGDTVKVHRDLDGHKIARRHPLDSDEAKILDTGDIDALTRKKLIDSNKKFPAATFLLTEKGREVAAALTGNDVTPLGAEGFVRD